MKKFFYLSAIIAAGLSSCAQNEIESVPALDQDNAVGFSAYSGQTRGQEMTVEGLKDGFGIYGYYHQHRDYMQDAAAGWDNEDENWYGSDFMRNTKVTHSDNEVGTIGNWVYSPIKYWSNNTKDRHSFVAYAPYAELDIVTGVSNNEEGIMAIDRDVTYPQEVQTAPILEFQMPASPVDMIDLVGAQAFDKSKLNGETGIGKYPESKVDLQFKHLMTKINLKAQLAGEIAIDKTNQPENEARVVITSIKLVGSQSQLKDKDEQLQSAVALHTSGKFYFGGPNDGIGSWDALVPSSEDYDLNQDGFLDFETIKGIDIYNKKGNEVFVEPTNMFKDGEALYLLPPNGEEGLENLGDVKLYVEYDIIQPDGSLLYGDRNVISNQDVLEFGQGTLKMGTAYNVLLKIGVTSVDLEPSVAPWDEEDLEIVTPNDTDWD